MSITLKSAAPTGKLMGYGNLYALLLALLLPTSSLADPCVKLGKYDGSEDVTIWRQGVALVTAGMVAKNNTKGAMLAVTIEGAAPVLHELELVDMPDDLEFRPHGMYLDNVTQRIFTVSHGDAQQEESIVVFAIEEVATSLVPRLRFMYALVSPKIEYYGADKYWFLNDVVVARRQDGTEEVLSTQFGPHGDAKEFHVWRCTFDAAGATDNKRVPMQCTPAFTSTKGGLNGLTISTDGRKLWANQLWEKRLLAIERDPASGVLSHRADDDIPLDGYADNVEFDHATGELLIGDVGALQFEPSFAYIFNGGLTIAKPTTTPGPTGGAYTLSTGFRQASSKILADYVVSSAVPFGPEWLIVGSPFNEGLAVCRVGYTLPSRLSSLKAKVVAGFSKLVNDVWPTKRKAAEEEAPGKKEL